MTTTPATSSPKKKKPSTRPKRSTTDKLLGIPGQATRQQAMDNSAQQTAETYADQRLLDITVAVQRIAFWVTLWSVLSLFGFGVFLLITLASSR